MSESVDAMLMEKKALFGNVRFVVTNPDSGPRSINNEEDARESLGPCIAKYKDWIKDFDAFLVACYSDHPLVGWLRTNVEKHKPVMGIFDSSILASLSALKGGDKYGIVSTGKAWEKILTQGVNRIAKDEHRPEIADHFAGVETTGLSAVELHEVPRQELEKRMKDAVKRLMDRGSIGCICLGCAGMVGMESIVRQAITEHRGKEFGETILVVDGVVHGMLILIQRLGGT